MQPSVRPLFHLVVNVFSHIDKQKLFCLSRPSLQGSSLSRETQIALSSVFPHFPRSVEIKSLQCFLGLPLDILERLAGLFLLWVKTFLPWGKWLGHDSVLIKKWNRKRETILKANGSQSQPNVLQGFKHNLIWGSHRQLNPSLYHHHWQY